MPDRHRPRCPQERRMQLDTSRDPGASPRAGSAPSDLRGDAPGTPDVVSRAVARALDEEGIGAVLRLLNGRTRFRFTGLYRAAPPLLENVDLFDRENPRLNVSGDRIPLERSYCSIVCAT